MTTIFFSPLSFVAGFGSGIRDPGSGMGKNEDPGSGINIPDLPHWEWMNKIYYSTLFYSLAVTARPVSPVSW
jgi:hypothetical protein